MLLYPARRHRRPLLFPPGLLALGFLLLLGCLALRPWYRLLEKKSVLALTVPPKPTSDFIYPVITIEGDELKELEKLGYVFKPNHNSNKNLQQYSQLAHFRNWQDFAFTGEPEQDAATAREAQQALRTMQADTSHAEGIRIRFGEQATYARLVQVVGWANAIEQYRSEKHLFDFQHTPVTFYAYTKTTGLSHFCGTDYYVVNPTKPLASFEAQMQNWLTRWQQTWSGSFSSSIWQLPILFLLIIIAVNCWKMARQWHTA